MKNNILLENLFTDETTEGILVTFNGNKDNQGNILFRKIYKQIEEFIKSELITNDLQSNNEIYNHPFYTIFASELKSYKYNFSINLEHLSKRSLIVLSCREECS